MAKAPAVIAVSPPHALPRFDLADVVAWKALADGNATPEQQQRFVKWLLRDVTHSGSLSFHPGPDGELNTAFKEGRRSVGVVLFDLMTAPLEQLRKKVNATPESSSFPGRPDGGSSPQ